MPVDIRSRLRGNRNTLATGENRFKMQIFACDARDKLNRDIDSDIEHIEKIYTYMSVVFIKF